MQALIRRLVLRLLRLFYPRIEVHGRERLPRRGSVIYVLNHPNSLLDPLLLMAILNRRITFLAKSTLFSNPVTRFAMDAFGAQPIYRKQDVGKEGGAKTKAPERNDETFARCRALLRQGRPMAMFPEGVTHSEPALQRIKTGAARIALGAEAESGWQMGLTIMPVGLWYESKVTFRSAALLVVGQPIEVDDYRELYEANEREAVDTLTDRVAEGLAAVVLQAEDEELLHGATHLAALDVDHDGARLTPLYERAAALLERLRHLRQQDPAQVNTMLQQAREYGARLRRVGAERPADVEFSLTKRQRIAALIVALTAGLPFAAAGFVLGWLPYRLGGIISTQLTKKDVALQGMTKLAVGSGLFTVYWSALAALVGRRAGRRRGLQLLAIAPPLSYIALRWTEGWQELRASLRTTRLHNRPLAQQLRERRHELRERLQALLEPAAEPSPGAAHHPLPPAGEGQGEGHAPATPHAPEGPAEATPDAPSHPVPEGGEAASDVPHAPEEPAGTVRE